MHKLICSQCLRHVHVVPPLSIRRISCSHVRPYSRWFALYEDVTPVEIPISELPPSSSSFTHEAPIGLNTFRSTSFRRSTASSYVPTLVDTSELGGRDIVDEDAIGNILGVPTGNVPTFYDFDTLLATVEESNPELPKIDNISSRDLLPASTLRGSSIKTTSKSSTEKEHVERSSRGQGVRSRFLSSVAASSLVAERPTVASKVEEKMEAVEVEREVIPEVPMREGDINIEELLAATRRSDMSSLRSLLAESYWPKAQLSPYQISQIFTLVVEKARNCEECREIIRDFACASYRHSLPSHIPILLAARSAREEGVQRALEDLQFHHKAFIMAPLIVGGLAPLRTTAMRSLWMEVAKKAKKEDVFEIYEKGVSIGLLDGTKELMEEMLKEKKTSGSSFASIFREWKELGERYGSRQYGLGTVVSAAMDEEGEMRRDAFHSLSSFVATSPHLKMESFVAFLVLNLLSRGEEKAAKHVFSLVSIHGYHWNQILRDMERDQCADNVVLIEKIANLITYGVIGEIRKVTRKTEETVTDDSVVELKTAEEKNYEMKDDLSSIMEMVVWKANGGKNDKKKKGPKKEKKRAKVDQKEIHELTERIQMTWLNLEQSMNGTSSEGLVRLCTWSMLHRLAIPPSISHLIPSIEKKGNKRESRA